MIIGYARVSTEDQKLDAQINVLKAAGADRIFTDKLSGKTTKRPGLDECLRAAEEGDVIVVAALDRLGRSLRSLLGVLDDLERRGVGFRALNLALDTTTPIGRFGVQMMGAVAELERGLISDRTKAGLAVAKAKGKQIGRQVKATPARVEQARLLILAGKSYKQVSAETGLSEAALYRDLPGGVRAVRDAAGSTP